MRKEINIKASQGTNNFINAKKNKNDEFFTRREDIEKELSFYRHHFKNKVVFLNCDDPKWSEFYFYFSANFNFLGLKRLIATHYGKDAYVLIKTKSNDIKIPLKQGGDFRSEECINYLKEADIVVSNPPFSLFKEYLKQLIDYDKKFLVIGNVGAVSYRTLFSLFRDNKVWLGVNEYIGWFYRITDKITNPRNKKVEISSLTPLLKENQFIEKVNINNMGNWFTNLEHNKKNQKLILTQKYYGNEEMYPHYDNYNAINVNRVKDIPKDYDGVMGVPITFIRKYNPKQFRIIGSDKGNKKRKLKSNKIDPINTIGVAHPKLNGKRMYERIFIQKI